MAIGQGVSEVFQDPFYQKIKEIDGVLLFQMVNIQQMLVGEKAFQLVCIADSGVVGFSGIIS